VRWTGSLCATRSGKHDLYSQSHNSLYRVWLDDEVVIDAWQRERNGPHRAQVTLEGGREYRVKIEWKKTRYSGGLEFGYRYSGGSDASIAECVAAARRADAAVVCVGFDRHSEGEGFDRPFAMNEELVRMLQAVARVQPNTVVVLTAGGNVDMEPWIDQVPALVHAWYPGQAGGQALAEIQCGRVNPSGRLPASFERRLADRSSFDSYHDDDGDQRVQLKDGIITGYRHCDQTGTAPRFAFGHGLSYTRFAYENLELSRLELRADEALEVSLDVINVGERAGAEVVQLYVSDLACRLPRAPKELKGFCRVELAAGERRRVSLSLGVEALQFYDPELRAWTHEPGEFELSLASSASDVRLRARFRLSS
jgi:beta-glucosidase